jgi:hypothetical protein
VPQILFIFDMKISLKMCIMNKTIQHFIVAVLLLLMPMALLGQIIVSPAKAGKSPDATGFYYALPHNYVQLDFILEKTQRYKGPYAEYASRILGVDDYVKQDEVRYQIADVIISSYSEPDPNAYYFVEFDERNARDVRTMVFSMLPDGIIVGADDTEKEPERTTSHIEKTLVNADDTQRFHYFAERNLYQRIDTIVRRITIDTTTIRRNILQSSWVDRNPEQKARAAADHIHRIREARYNLISGYQEINYGQSIVYMDQQLQQLEEEYLSLFLGKEVRTLEEKRFYYLPEKDNGTMQNFLKFSEASGIESLAGRGEAIQIKVETAGNTSQIANDNKNIGNIRLNNSMYYRMPEYATVSVVLKGNTLGSERMAFSQLGILSVAPLTRARLLFDPETGAIKTVKRD